MNTTEQTEPTIAALVAKQLKAQRDDLLDELNLCDKAAAIMERLPREAVEWCCISCKTLLIYNQDREGALAIIGALGAGRWTKQVNPAQRDRIDYSATIDGVPVQIYAADPPESCRIVIEEVDVPSVPAHKEMKRTLICK